MTINLSIYSTDELLTELRNRGSKVSLCQYTKDVLLQELHMRVKEEHELNQGKHVKIMCKTCKSLGRDDYGYICCSCFGLKWVSARLYEGSNEPE